MLHEEGVLGRLVRPVVVAELHVGRQLQKQVLRQVLPPWTALRQLPATMLT